MTGQTHPPPSCINFDHFPPLVGTLGRSELEQAAWFLAYICAKSGDTWREVPLSELVTTYGNLIADKHPMTNNPFLNPDFPALVPAGFAVWGGDNSAEMAKRPLAFTDAGIAAITKHYRPE